MKQLDPFSTGRVASMPPGIGAFIAMIMLLAACTLPPAPPPRATPALRGGILATFDVVGQEFKVWVTNDEPRDDSTNSGTADWQERRQHSQWPHSARLR